MNGKGSYINSFNYLLFTLKGTTVQALAHVELISLETLILLLVSFEHLPLNRAEQTFNQFKKLNK